MRFAKPAVALVLSLCLLSAQTADVGRTIRGFSAVQAKLETSWEEKLDAIPDPVRLRAYMERMSRLPHHAGSPGSKATAEYLAGLLRDWGLDTHIEQFEALMPYPAERQLEMVSPAPFTARLQEPPVPADPSSSNQGQLPTYNAYSADGDVTAPLIYVNYGTPDDYNQLAQRGIDVRGKIVIARYGKSWRGVKPKVAQEHGAVGCLIYSDPHEDGYYTGDVFPKGAYRPEQGVQRGSVIDMAIYPGDPLTPGWADEPGARRLKREEAATLMKIPVLPISYGDAEPLLKRLGGPVVPEPWRGGLPMTYHAGPGEVIVHLKVKSDWAIRPLYDVIATIAGSTWPDQWVIYGNHHDAWVHGASDPVSGVAALLEVARGLAELRHAGWQPRRTIKLALWDGEEFGLIGSTEWAEKHGDELARKGVAYLNSDSNGRGTLGAAGSPSLETFLTEVLRDVRSPISGHTVLELTRGRHSTGFSDASEEHNVRLAPLGAGSDYVAFAHHDGIASLNLGFDGDNSGGVYHSIYDSFYWYTHFSDSDFVYGRALSQIFGKCLLRLADATVLPFEFRDVARTIHDYVNEVRREAGRHGDPVNVTPMLTELAKMSANADTFEAALAGAQARWTVAKPDQLASLNEVLARAERALLLPQGLPGRPWYKSQIAAPGRYTGYGAKTLPGVREAVEMGRYDEANVESDSVAQALRAYNNRIEEATRLLKGM